MMSMEITHNVTVGGRTITESATLEANTALVVEDSIPAAKAGTLSAKTDADTGTATMTDVGHGVATSDIVDVYWDGGARRGMTVGSVSGTSVPLDGGSGDDLPAATTAITVAVRVVYEFNVVGDDIVGLAIGGDARCTVILAGADDAEDFARVLDASRAYSWHDGRGETNPVAGDTVTQIFVTQASTSAAVVRVAAIHD